MNKKVTATLVILLLSILTILILIFLRKWDYVIPIFILMMSDYFIMAFFIQKCHMERVKELGIKKSKHLNDIKRLNYFYQGWAITISIISCIIVVLTKHPPIKMIAIILIGVCLSYLFKTALIKYDGKSGDLK